MQKREKGEKVREKRCRNYYVGVQCVWFSWWFSCVITSLNYYVCYRFSCRNGIRSKLLWKRLVSAINWKRACKYLAVVNNLAILMSCPPVFVCRVCLAPWCAGQCSIRCWTVSGLCKHAGHIGESAFLIWCKCLARAVWLVHNCVSILVSFLGSFAVSLMKLLDSAVRSVIFILSKRGGGLFPLFVRSL